MGQEKDGGPNPNMDGGGSCPLVGNREHESSPIPIFQYRTSDFIYNLIECPAGRLENGVF